MKKYLITMFILFPLFAFAQTFDQDLFYSLKANEEVKELQEFLIDKGFYGGPITGNFFSLTLTAVKKFQTAYSITPTSGYFGPKSRAKANELLAVAGISKTEITTETGTTPTPVVTAPKTNADVVNSLMEQIKLLQQQLTLLQQQQTTLQQQNQQLAQQTQTLQQIQQQTAPPPPPPPALIPISQAKIEPSSYYNSNPIIATGWNRKEIPVFVYGDRGEKVTNVQVKVTTPDEKQNTTLGGARLNTGAYTFDYYPKSVGTHTIIFSVPSYGVTKSISFEATKYTRRLPTFRFDPRSASITSIRANSESPQGIATIEVTNPDLGDQYYIRNFSYKIISDTLTDQDIEISLWSGGYKLDLQNPFDYDPFRGALGSDTQQMITLKANISKLGKFKVSIGARFFSVNEPGPGNVEFFLTNLPLITPEIEIK